MAALLGDLLQFTVFQTLAGQQCLNVYYYRVTSLTGFTNDGYEPLLGEFITQVILPTQDFQSVHVQYDSVEVRNLSNGVDFFNVSYAPGFATGDITGDVLPSYVTYTFRLVRETLATRNGYKRIAGVPESAGSANGFTPGTTLIQAYTDAVSADLVLGLVTIAEPVIVKRPISVPAGDYVYSSIGSADFRGVGSQNTRKPGHGN